MSWMDKVLVALKLKKPEPVKKKRKYVRKAPKKAEAPKSDGAPTS